MTDDEIRLVPALTLARVLDLMDRYVMPMDERVYRAFDRSSGRERRRAHRPLDRRDSTRAASRCARSVGTRWSGLTEPDAIAAAVEWLAAMGWVREADPEQRPGRPANRYDVNPRIWEADDAGDR